MTTEQHAVADRTTSGFASSAEYEAALERAGDRDRFFDTTVQVQLAIESTDVDARCSWTPSSSSRDLLRPITELPDEVVHERAVLWIEDYLEVEEMCLAGFPEGAFAQHKQTREEFDDIVDLIEERAAQASE